MVTKIDSGIVVKIYISFFKDLITSTFQPTTLAPTKSITSITTQTQQIITPSQRTTFFLTSQSSNLINLSTNINNLTTYSLTKPTLTTSSDISNSKSFNNLSPQQLSDILESVDYDVTGCLVNCTNNGICEINIANGRFECSCKNDYYGSDCKSNKKLCTGQTLCLNQGTCVDIIEVDNKTNSVYYSYRCECEPNYYGSRCQYEVDLCKNKTCSSNGNCMVNSTKVPWCKCFMFYNGADCEQKSAELVTIIRIISTASVIAIVAIVLIYVMVILIDLSNFYIDKSFKRFIPKNI